MVSASSSPPALLADYTRLTEIEHGEPFDSNLLMWRVILHLTFVASGVLLALTDWLGAKRLVITKQTHGHGDTIED